MIKKIPLHILLLVIAHFKIIQLAMSSSSRRNASFISNQQLLQHMKTKTSRSLSRNKSLQSNNISLIQPRKYQHGSSNKLTTINKQIAAGKENNNYSNNHTSRDKQNNSKVNAQEGGHDLVSFLRSNISNKKLLSQAEKLIQALPDTDSTGRGMSKQQAALMAKIESLYLDKTKLKKERRALQQKVKDQAMEYEAKLQEIKKQNQRLHRLVLKQSQLITNQSQVQQDPSDDLRKILVAQAKAIQALQASQNQKRNHTYLR